MPQMMNEGHSIRDPEIANAANELIAMGERMGIIIAVAMISEEQREIAAFGACCASHTAQLFRDVANAVDTLDREGAILQQDNEPTH